MRFVLASLMLLVVACQPAAGPLSGDDVAALQELGKSYARAVLAGDADAVAALYTDDAVEMPPGAPERVGREAIRAGYQGGGETTEFTMIPLQIEGRADLAYDRGGWSWTGVMPGTTEPRTEVGKYLAIARRQADGSWRWTAAIWNSDAPPPGVE